MADAARGSWTRSGKRGGSMSMAKRANVCRPIPHERGEIVLIEYHADHSVAAVGTRDDGIVTLHLFVESERDGTTYIDEEQTFREAEGVRINGWATKTPTAPIWHVDGLLMKRFLRHGKPEGEYGNRPCIYTKIRGDVDLARLGMHRVDTPLSPDPFDGAEDLDGFSLDFCQFCGFMRADYDNLCRHVFDGPDGMEGPGEDSYREPYEVPDGFKRLVRRLGCARHLLAHLAAGKFPALHTHGSMLGPASVSAEFAGKRFDDAFDRISSNPGDHEDDYQQGFLWMSSMDEHTTGFNGSVCAWLRKEVSAQDDRRAWEVWYAVRSGWSGTLRAKRRTYADARDIATRLRAKGERGVHIVRQVPKAAG